MAHGWKETLRILTEPNKIIRCSEDEEVVGCLVVLLAHENYWHKGEMSLSCDQNVVSSLAVAWWQECWLSPSVG
jgi:hypothetical protein